MTDDQRLATLLAECIADLDAASAEGRAGLTYLLRQIEDASPGAVEQMAARIQLARLPRTTAH
ncbi:hypothetical protein [Brevundimonas sp. GCM10030266]|uniref:hypothetical protein n=1 Tax=Brevundimonas sp. GCM10030266 TaxID=3273386 RepID=UPI0036170544